MGITHTDLKSIVAAFAVLVTFSLPLGAQEADESALLGELAQAEPAEVARIERELKSIWSKSGSSAMDFLLKRGRDALERGDFAAAVDHLTALTDHAPDFAEGWHARAQAFFAAERYGPALSDLERALALNPNNYSALYGLGAIFETFGDKARAFEVYSRVQAIHPHYENVVNALDRLKPQIEGQSL
jgi:tetratricopeptide (TPR) repeat protein